MKAGNMVELNLNSPEWMCGLQMFIHLFFQRKFQGILILDTGKNTDGIINMMMALCHKVTSEISHSTICHNTKLCEVNCNHIQW